MTVFSMTGFGQAVVDRNSMGVKVELKSVNHRFAEFNTRLPRDLLPLEDEIRSYLSGRIARGRTDVFVTLDEGNHRPQQLHVNWELFDALCEVEREARLRSQAVDTGKAAVINWLTFPDVLQVRAESIQVDALRDAVMQAVHEACDAILEMRQREGTRLEHDLNGKLVELRQVVRHISEVASEVHQQLRNRLLQRLADVAPQIDEQRLLTEIALLAERSTIDEELVRLESHIDEFEASLQGGSPVGRKLDFIVQEMHREVNTIGSKSTDVRVSKSVVHAKTIVEQLREQVQNIE